jgi:hypothetical protein
MKSFSTLGMLSALALAGAFCVSSLPARAQASAPVMVKQISPKPVWLRAEVVHFDRNSIVVRQEGNELKILTFTYSAKAQQQIQKALDTGGYQRDDKVRIRYVPGQSVALAIHGKPSKASAPSTPSHPVPTAPQKAHPTPQTQ